MARFSPQAALGFLLVLTVVAWGIVVAELALVGTVSIFAIANATVFTLTLALWPLLTGTRVGSQGIRVPVACRECGTLAMPVPRISFCLHCGAYPKEGARKATSQRAPAPQSVSR